MDAPRVADVDCRRDEDAGKRQRRVLRRAEIGPRRSLVRRGVGRTEGRELDIEERQGRVAEVRAPARDEMPEERDIAVGAVRVALALVPEDGGEGEASEGCARADCAVRARRARLERGECEKKRDTPASREKP